MNQLSIHAVSIVNKCNLLRIILIYQKNKVVKTFVEEQFVSVISTFKKNNGTSKVKQQIIHNLISELIKTDHLQKVNDLTIIIQFRQFCN